MAKEQEQEEMEAAVSFYNKDSHLSRTQRSLLADSWRTISTCSVISHALSVVPAVVGVSMLYRQARGARIREGSITLMSLLGIASMVGGGPMGTKAAHAWQASVLRSQDRESAEMLEFLDPSYNGRWAQYYGLTRDHPEWIKGDPRITGLREFRDPQGPSGAV